MRKVRRENARDMKSGDVLCVNAPYNGGARLPDITVITPCFRAAGTTGRVRRSRFPIAGDTRCTLSAKILFGAGRASHHADIGGSMPASTPPDGRTAEREGIPLFDNYRLAEGRRFLEKELRPHLVASP